MFISLPKRCVGILSVACVLALALFPLAHGPFQATHGSTTALRAKRAFLVLLMSIMAAALRVIGVGSRLLILPAFATEAWRRRRPYFEDGNIAAAAAILRC